MSVNLLSQNAFSCEYYREEISASIVKHAEWCLDRWDWTKYYSPYSTIYNASMMGKSRAVSDLFKFGVFTVYFNLQSPESENIPKRPPYIASWLTAGHHGGSNVCEQRFSGMLIEVIRYLNDWLSEQNHSMNLAELAELWKNEQKSYHFWPRIIELAENYPEIIRSAVRRDADARGIHNSASSFPDRCHNYLLGTMLDAHVITVSLFEKFADISNKREEFGFPENNKRAYVLFVFDDARQLLSHEHLIDG